MTDPIADMLTRIRNAALARHDRTEMPASKMKKAVADILKSEGYIADVRPSDGDTAKLTIVLKYGRDRTSPSMEFVALADRAVACTSSMTGFLASFRAWESAF
jgi:ribosomal protein S8